MKIHERVNLKQASSTPKSLAPTMLIGTTQKRTPKKAITTPNEPAEALEFSSAGSVLATDSWSSKVSLSKDSSLSTWNKLFR